MDNTSIITQVNRDEDLNTFPPLEKGTATVNSPKAKKPKRKFFKSLFCCLRQNNNNSESSCPVPVSEEHIKPNEKYLLPSVRHQDMNKKCVVIDLDETLVHSSFKPISNADFIVPVEIDGTLHQLRLAMPKSCKRKDGTDERHVNKRKELPHPDDVEKLATYLITEINKLELSIIKCDAVVFRETVILTEARLLLYNRRRPGELESLSIAAYESRSTSLDDADMALRNSMTEFERMLMKTQDLVEIRGKVGRGVPVIIPNEVRKPLRFLANHKARQQGGIRAGNIYMFANTGEAVVRAGDALDEVKRRADLKYPERIYANNLRKHTATIVQALNLDDNEVKWVCNHLGHIDSIPRIFQRTNYKNLPVEK